MTRRTGRLRFLVVSAAGLGLAALLAVGNLHGG